MIEFTKSEKRELRNLAGEAYEIELANELQKLSEKFESWKQGNINVFDLDESVHKYYSGPRKNLYKLYEMQNQPGVAVARAFASGTLSKDRLPSALLNKIQNLISFFQNN